jgi:large subunit ribosomal protein L13
MKTYQPKEKEVRRSWHLIDAKGEILGRLATKIAVLLTGKVKPTYSTHMDMGDFVVVLNGEKVEVTGKKSTQKVYRSHSGYSGGLKEVSFKRMLDTHPERILERAVLGMIPDNRLKKGRMARLKVVVGDKNPYEEKFKEN